HAACPSSSLVVAFWQRTGWRESRGRSCRGRSWWTRAGEGAGDLRGGGGRSGEGARGGSGGREAGVVAGFGRRVANDLLQRPEVSRRPAPQWTRALACRSEPGPDLAVAL